MSGGFVAVGGIATGALVGHAVEPDARGAHVGGETQPLCLNCGTRLIGDHCHACGQSAHVHRTLGAIGHDIAHGVLHFEGRIWRTLPMLVLHPGALTRRYVAGERARFVSPLALFLFVVFVMFALLSILGKHLEAPEIGFEQGRATAGQLERSITENGERIATLARRRARALTDGEPVVEIDRDIAARQTVQRSLTGTLAIVRPKPGDNGGDEIATGWKRLDKGLNKARENPNLLLYKLQTNAYKFSWALIPISLPFLWILFPFSRRFHVYDHAVFITYSLSFVSLLGLGLSLLGIVGVASGLLWTALAIVVPIHMYKQLRGAYRLGRAGAFVRMVLLVNLAGIAGALFITLLIGLGLLG